MKDFSTRYSGPKYGVRKKKEWKIWKGELKKKIK